MEKAAGASFPALESFWWVIVCLTHCLHPPAHVALGVSQLLRKRPHPPPPDDCPANKGPEGWHELAFLSLPSGERMPLVNLPPGHPILVETKCATRRKVRE